MVEREHYAEFLAQIMEQLDQTERLQTGEVLLLEIDTLVILRSA